MKKILFLLFFCLFAIASYSQSLNVTGICAGAGNPNGTGRNITNQTQLFECSVYKDTLTNGLWVYEPTLPVNNRWIRVPVEFENSTWINVVDLGGTHEVTLNQNGATNGQVIKWNGTAWVPSTDAGTTYTAGSGINITSNTIAATDFSISNEGSLTVGAGTATTSVISSNTTGSTPVTLTAGTNITLTETGNNITIDASGTTYTAGSGISIASNVITATDPGLTNEGSLTVGAGTATTSIINSNTSGSTGVTLTAGTGLSITESGNIITLATTETALPVYLTNAAAVAALGVGKRYRVGLGSTEDSVGTVKETY